MCLRVLLISEVSNHVVNLHKECQKRYSQCVVARLTISRKCSGVDLPDLEMGVWVPERDMVVDAKEVAGRAVEAGVYNGAGFWNQDDIYQVCCPMSSRQRRVRSLVCFEPWRLSLASMMVTASPAILSGPAAR